MNDIDFDELDRAVSTALGSPSDSSNEPTAPAAQPATPAPATETPTLVVPERTSATSDRPVQAPAARRGGRFMDVVHPSSDMRSTGGSTPSAPAAVPAPTPEPTEKPAEQAWPDPIDLANQTNEPSEPTLVEQPVDSSNDSPLESPFVNGAKVEKRPLGGPTPTSSLDDALAQLNMSDEPTNEMPSEEVTPETPVPSTPEPVMAAPVLEDTEAEALGETAFAEPVAIDAPANLEASNAPKPEPTHVNPSIPQQYTEHAPVHDAEQSGSIYDTESYHQPLAHPAKKHGSWVIILWILGLVVLGGGLGAAAYFFLLPLL